MGLVVVLGWKFEIPQLVRVLPGLAPMQLNNALCFILLGASGIAYQLNRKKTFVFLGMVGILLSGLTLIQYVLNTNLGIDLLFMDTHEMIPTSHPGRMAPNSAFAHVLSFAALLLLALNRFTTFRVASWLGAVVVAFGIVSLAGYLIDIEGGFSWGKYTQMALPTSVGFIIIGSAIGVAGIPRRIHFGGRKFSLWPYEIIILATVFLIDLQLPQGVAVGLLYVMPLLASWYFPNRSQILVVAVICNGLIALDVIVATESLDSQAVYYNRVVSVLAVWVAAAIFFYLKRISDQQKESDLKFKLAVEGTTAGIWDWISVDSNEEWWSPKFYQLLGYENNEIEASLDNFSSFLHPDDAPSTFKLVERHLTKRAPFIIEYRLQHKSGKYKWFLGSGQATWDKDGKPIRMVGTIVDINARKLAEVAEQERTIQLAQKNRELEEFTYVASHDLQEPVRTISSFVKLFKQTYSDKLDDEANTYLDFMEGASKRSQQLIVDLLDYSRLGKDRKTEKVNLNQVLQNVLIDLTVRIKESGAEVTLEQLPEIEGQTTELRLLFQNLISNAIKFRKKDITPKIHVSVEANDDEYSFSISDNGIGIDEKYLDRIFVIFKRLHGKSEFEGTGIGLAHCKKVVELHGGRIWVESRLTQGSTFKFCIPVINES